ncbi:hypothetical protein IMCC3317_12280 [Kordia antarctica]|uniref:Uncharacterized protein n=1 Tax=Kordia antarctica TaxID=1218801 RepID=A0A7L4ZH73_9FLAO|nr:hypothetical protein IMCC3317_12280 [Kordia antarctica]
MNFSKFSPRIRKFLTKNPCYTAEKTKNTLEFYITDVILMIFHFENKKILTVFNEIWKVYFY